MCYLAQITQKKDEGTTMTIEEVKAQLRDGFAKVQPSVVATTQMLMDAYEQGFKTCWKLLTGQEMEEQ